jgi:hypothetical protein
MPKLKEDVIKALDKFGPFDFGDIDRASLDSLNKKCEKRQPIKLPNGDVYDGEWIVGTDTREGKGRLVYSDGKLYDGWFKDN